MLRFKHLRLKGTKETALKLLDVLKSNKGKIFEYNRPFTEEYAKNIFRAVSEVGCFKTSRTSLYESSVWLIFDKDHLYVTNITSEINTSLSKKEYNLVLDTFLNEFVKPLLKDDLKDILVDMTPGELAMSDLVSESAFKALSQWEASYDKDFQEEDFVCYNLWIKSIVSLVKNNDELEYDDFKEWLASDCGWTESLDDKIYDFYSRYEVGKDVLNEWKNENQG